MWDRANQYGLTFGEATGSAAFLDWAAAQYVRLALSIDAGHPVETPPPCSPATEADERAP